MDHKFPPTLDRYIHIMWTFDAGSEPRGKGCGICTSSVVPHRLQTHVSISKSESCLKYQDWKGCWGQFLSWLTSLVYLELSGPINHRIFLHINSILSDVSSPHYFYFASRKRTLWTPSFRLRLRSATWSRLSNSFNKYICDETRCFVIGSLMAHAVLATILCEAAMTT